MDLDTSTTALLACHWENDVVGPEGAFAPFFRAEVERRDVIAVATRLIEGARRSGVQVVHGRIAFGEGHADLTTNIPLLGIVAQQGSLLDGTAGTDIIDELQPAPTDWVVTNTKVSSFVASNLDAELRAAGINTVVIFGVATNISVESTARSAGDLGYRVIVAEDACSAASQEAHAATIETFGLLGEVASADDVLAAL